MLSTKRWARAAVVLVAATGLTGCGTSAGITGGQSAGPANENSAEYLDRLSSETEVTENDALSGMLLLLDGADEAGTFAQRVTALEQRGIVAGSWAHDSQRALTRGRLAYMICQACKIKGGVILRLLGSSQRYCLRELQYMEMMGDGMGWGEVTGMEMVAVLSRADTYIRTGKVPNRAGEIED